MILKLLFGHAQLVRKFNTSHLGMLNTAKGSEIDVNRHVFIVVGEPLENTLSLHFNISLIARLLQVRRGT